MILRIPSCLLLGALALSAASPATYGRPLSSKPEVRISEILAHPEQYKEKEVKVRGLVTQVCEKRGCFMMLKSDAKFQQIMVKVQDGVIVFPADGAGREAVVDGIVKVKVYSEADQKALCDDQRAALFGKEAAKEIKGPRSVVRLQGLGARL